MKYRVMSFIISLILYDLGIITAKARHENRKAWKHYGNTYGSQVHEFYEFKHIIRNRRNENRILTYKIEIEKGQKNWRVRIREGYRGEFSDSDKEFL